MENANDSFDMNTSFEDLTFDDDFEYFNHSYYQYTPVDTHHNWSDYGGFQDFYYTIADDLRNGETLLVLCGLIPNVMFIVILIGALCKYTRCTRGITSCLWLVLGMLCSHTLFLAIWLLRSVFLIIIFEQLSKEAFCIFITSIFECLDFASILTSGLLAGNVFWLIGLPSSRESQIATLLWILSGFAAWVVGLGVGLGIGAAVTETASGHCIGQNAPFYVGVIRFVIEFLFPYTGGLILTCSSVFRWRRISMNAFHQNCMPEGLNWRSTGIADVSMAKVSSESDEGTGMQDLTTEGRSCDSTTEGRSSDSIQNPKSEGRRKDSDPVSFTATTTAASFCIQNPVSSHPDENQAKSAYNVAFEQADNALKKRSLKLWVIFSAVNILFGCLCRLLISLPITELLYSWKPHILFWMSAHIALVLYLTCFPFLCLIISEVREAFRMCRSCCKIVACCCNCSQVVDN